jgi:hypothetical protein
MPVADGAWGLKMRTLVSVIEPEKIINKNSERFARNPALLTRTPDICAASDFTTHQ